MSFGNKGGRPSKLTPEQYRDVRVRAAMGASHKALAREFGLARQSITRIAKEGLKRYEAARAGS